MYGYPFWRRLPFIALLIGILLLSYAPATTQGNVTVRISALTTPGIVTHLYLGVTTFELHREGFASNLGWTNISQAFPAVDLFSSKNQTVAQTMVSTAIHSGAFDAVRILFSNSSMVIQGNATLKPLIAPGPLFVNSTVLVSPNGIGDLDLLVAFDYAALLSDSPTLSLVLVRSSAT